MNYQRITDVPAVADLAGSESIYIRQGDKFAQVPVAAFMQALGIKDGKDGISPTVSVAAIAGGHRITITDVNGTKTVDVLDGQPGDDGVTPNLQIGTVTTLPAGNQATAKITGTAANPVLSLGIPQGADAAGGSIGVTAGYGRCSDVPDAVTKSVAIQTEGMKVIDGSTLLVLFDAPNTAADVMLNINGSMLAVCDSCGNPANAATMAGDIHLFALLPALHSAILINPTTAATLSAAVERGLTT